MAVEEERDLGREVIHLEAGVDRGLHEGDRVRERERHLLYRRATLLPHVVAGDRDRVPLRDALVAVGEDVGREAHRALRRVDEVPTRRVLLEDVVLDRAAQLLRGDALLLADELVEEKKNRRRCVDRHRRRDLVQRNLVETGAHVIDRVDRDARAPDLAEAARVVRVAAELGGEVERHRETGRAVLEQVAVAGVGLSGGRVAGVLAHRPAPRAVHLGVDTAGERILAGRAETLLKVEIRDVGLVVDDLRLDAGVGEAARVVRADQRRDPWLLGLDAAVAGRRWLHGRLCHGHKG